VRALGRDRVHAVVGHDFGSPLAAWCALARPDVFPAVALMSAPFAGPPALDAFDAVPGAVDIHAALAALERPRKHYQWYYSTREADAHMRHCPQGLHAFLRAYYHHKSAEWHDTDPAAGRWTAASSLACPPTHHGPERDMAATGVTHAYARPGGFVAGSPRPAAVRRRVRAHRLPGRPAVVPLHDSPAIAASCGCSRPSHRRAGARGERQDWGVYSGLATSSACKAWAADLHGCYLVEAPATGCSRNRLTGERTAAGIPRQAAVSLR
jgi:pimeloyl-ACP methyl ester carboxylesterase